MEKGKRFTVSDLPRSARPRERLQKYGPEALSPQEILACIIGRGTRGKPVLDLVQELVSSFGGLNGLARASLHDLMEVDGIGPAKAVQIRAAFELARRSLEQEAETANESKRPLVRTGQDVFELMRSRTFGQKTEHFFIMALDSRSRLIGIREISNGSLNSTVVHPREVFTEAIALHPAAVIFVHNHPSGDPEPSDDDIALTKRLVSAGQVMGIPVHDHVIVTDKAHASLRARNLV
jgi:DNA repair protein RadC